MPNLYKVMAILHFRNKTEFSEGLLWNKVQLTERNDPEDGGGTFLQHTAELYQTTTALYLRRQYSSLWALLITVSLGRMLKQLNIVTSDTQTFLSNYLQWDKICSMYSDFVLVLWKYYVKRKIFDLHAQLGSHSLQMVCLHDVQHTLVISKWKYIVLGNKLVYLWCRCKTTDV